MSKKTGNVKGSSVVLPKNIQQMGRTDGGIKVYLEDYSATWLRRILNEEQGQHGILLGRKQIDGNQTYFFIESVLAIEAQEQDGHWKYDWNHIYQLMQQYFFEEGKYKPEVLGWALAIDDYKQLDLNDLESMHKFNFQGNMTLTFTVDMQEGREQFYILENNKFHSLGGYYIYYEKNKAMQNYVLENQPGPCVETEEIVKGNSESYRSILLKKKEMVQRRYTVSVLYAASTFLVMIVIVLGITMMNNYEKMQNMQLLLNDLSQSVINEEVQAMENGVVPVTNHGLETTMEPVIDVVPALSTAVLTDVTDGAAFAEVSVQEVSTGGQNKKKYEIQPGDTLEAISVRVYNTDRMVDEICQCNDIEDGNQIVAGDVLILP